MQIHESESRRLFWFVWSLLTVAIVVVGWKVMS
jgi:hypothetical protein